MGSILWMSLLMVVFAEIPFSSAGHNYDGFKPWKVTSMGKKIKEKKVYKGAIHPTSIATSSSDDAIDWSAADMMQRPIDEPERKTNRKLGSPCSYSNDCSSSCCLLDRSTKIRSCQPKARRSERCSNFQVKGDLYVDACPCARGTNFCTHSHRCSW